MSEREVDMTQRVMDLLDRLRLSIDSHMDLKSFEEYFRKNGGQILIPDNLPVDESWDHMLLAVPRPILELIIVHGNDIKELNKELKDDEGFIVK